jgi:hypothetical protein
VSEHRDPDAERERAGLGKDAEDDAKSAGERT